MSKRWLGAVLMGAVVLASSPAAAELKTNAPVSAVTVYTDRAQVTRRIEVRVPAGDEVVVIEGLPAGLDVSTASVRGEASRPVRLSALEFQRIQLATVPDTQIEVLRKTIKDLQRQSQALHARSINIDAEMMMLSNLMEFQTARFTDGVRTGPLPLSATEIEAIVKTLRNRRDQNRNEYYELQTQLDDLNEKLNLAQREMGQLQHPQLRESLVARIPVSATQATPCAIELTYLISGASWSADYEVRALTDLGKVEIRYDARISQRTGEDWTNAEVTLTTAAPALGASVSYPASNRLWVPASNAVPVSPSPSPVARPTVTSAGMRGSEMDSAGTISLELATASLTTGMTVTYRIPGRITIPADNTDHRYAISVQTIATAFRYLAVPRHREYGYLLTETGYAGDQVYLAGPASIFQDQSFVGQVGMPTTTAGDTLVLQFGPDRRITVARRNIEVKRDNSGFRRLQTATYRATLVVANRRNVPVEVTLADRIPVSSVEDVTIELDPDLPKPDFQREDGVVLWNLNLAPNEERRIPLAYTVSWPEDVNLQGLE